MAEQLVFDLPARASLSRGDFFVAPANAEAVAAIDRSADWPNGRLTLVGPRGSGKTHLANVWAQGSGAEIVRAADLATADIPALGAAPALVVEDFDTITPDAETPAFHLVNLLHTSGARLLTTAKSPPVRWRLTLPDLASRMQAGGVATMAAPDDALLANLLLKLFSDRQIAPEPALIPWLVARIERSFAAAEEAVDRLDRAALKKGQNMTRPLARQVLDNDGDVTQ